MISNRAEQLTGYVQVIQFSHEVKVDNDKVAEAARQYLQWVYLVEVPKHNRSVSRTVCHNERSAFDNLLEAVTGLRQLTLAGPALGFEEPGAKLTGTRRISCKAPNLSNGPNSGRPPLIIPRSKT